MGSPGLLTSNLRTTAWPCRGASSCRAPERPGVWLKHGGWLVTITSTTKKPGQLAPHRATPDRPASVSHQRSWLTVRMTSKCQRCKDGDVTHTNILTHGPSCVARALDQSSILPSPPNRAHCPSPAHTALCDITSDHNAPLDQTGGSRDVLPRLVQSSLFLKLISQNKEERF